MAYKNFQTERPGTHLAFPYLAGQGATIVSAQPVTASTGSIRVDNGFVGLDVGDRAILAFDPPAVAFRVYLFCGASPTNVTAIDVGGTPHSLPALRKGPLQTGSIAYAGEGVATVILEHSNLEGSLLRLDWDNAEAAATVSSKSEEPTMSDELVAGILYAQTAGWRAAVEKAQDLEEARVRLASTFLSGGALHHSAIVPRAEDLCHPTVQMIWRSCLKAAARAASRASAAEGKVAPVPFTGSESGLGPFIDLGSRGTEIIVVHQP
ncbi:hypothetical protein [Sinorhizobium meliloti]|uniref:hypothetical protein n=1 Tax=Rhizobium meliloti TaxID=382 RepID=UPI000FD9C3EC|nr:hypothetical protein [Sinorhizobium meliloti]RVG20630.1 hypothetical protein CN231_04360 [Sinorhizobium meliloti]